MNSENRLSQIRPDSSFESFQPFTDAQLHGWEVMLKIADQIFENKDRILSELYPFPQARWIAITGKPGRGKSHLLEAFINYLGKADMTLLDRMYLSRSNFTQDNMIFPKDYDNKPIIMIDDIFVEHQDIHSLHPRTDIQSLFTFLKFIYERRALVITTCNFSFINQIIPILAEVDLTGRYSSRFSEISGNFGEIELLGPDYRQFNTLTQSVGAINLF